jgi:Amt family ammonium transporter
LPSSFSQTVFCATAATIVSGAMAERTKIHLLLPYSLVISAVIYPISGHWIWAASGFPNWASMISPAPRRCIWVGGVAALIGAKTLGPASANTPRTVPSRAILGHSLTLGALGVFILWFCWFALTAAPTSP